jgi:hypothetical protein
MILSLFLISIGRHNLLCGAPAVDGAETGCSGPRDHLAHQHRSLNRLSSRMGGLTHLKMRSRGLAYRTIPYGLRRATGPGLPAFCAEFEPVQKWRKPDAMVMVAGLKQLPLTLGYVIFDFDQKLTSPLLRE